MTAHEIDYELIGGELQCLRVELDPNESVIAEAGSMLYMEDDVAMETIFGDGSLRTTSFVDKLFAAGKRVLTGESLFLTAYTNQSSVKRKVAFASPYPGKIFPINLAQTGGTFICQKDAFLCAARGVSIGIEFQKRLGSGFFGGEGFIMERLEGDGMAFIHAGGVVMERTLAAGERLRVDTGCLVGFTREVDYNIEFVGKIRTALFGGEGMFFATLTGPGKVLIQSMPFSRLADRIIASAPSAGGKRRGERSILGGLGNLLDGDNNF